MINQLLPRTTDSQPCWQSSVTMATRLTMLLLLLLVIEARAIKTDNVTEFASSTIAVTTSSAASLQTCCTEQRVSSQCVSAICPRDDEVASAMAAKSIPPVCYADVIKMFRCLSAMHDGTSCCVRYNIPSRCLSLCNGDVLDLVVDGLDCFDHLPTVSRCFTEEHVGRPEPPTAIMLTSVSSTEARVSWYPSAEFAESVENRYTVQFQQYGIFMESQDTAQNTNYELKDLTPSTLYEVSISTNSSRGSSRPSSPLMFLTYPAPLVSNLRQPSTRTVSSSSDRDKQEYARVSVVSETAFTLTVTWTCPSLTTVYRIGHSLFNDTRSSAMDLQVVNCRQNIYIIQNLMPNTSYQIYLIPATETTARQHLSSVVAKTLPENITKGLGLKTDISECCNRVGVGAQCLPLCQGSDVIDLYQCSNDLIHMINCVSDRDNSRCCSQHNVPDLCLGFCSGNFQRIGNLSTLLCLSFTEHIFQCLQSEEIHVDGAPQDFNIVELGPSSATFHWTVESSYTYQLHYSLASVANQHGPSTVLEVTGSPFILHGLTPSTEYVARLVAQSSSGSSQATTTLSFYTHHEDSKMVHIQQSPAGFVTIGSRVMLTCSYSSSIPSSRLDVYWMRSETRIPGAVYVIENVQPEDAGRYTCVVGQDGEHIESAETFVHLQFAPEVVPVDYHVTAEINHTAHLTCRFIGFPETVDWYRSDSLVPIDGSRYSTTRYLHEEIGAIDVRLNIEYVTVGDYGIYRCEGRNQYSFAVSFVWLTDPDVSSEEIQHSDHLATGGVPDRPVKVHACLNDVGQIHVDWDMPSTTAAAGEFYKIFYTAESQENIIGVHTVTVREKSTVLTNVRPFTVYTITVTARNALGSSLPSASARVTTYELAPSAPLRLSVELIGAVTAKVSWCRPEYNGPSVTSYDVVCRQSTEPDNGQLPILNFHVGVDECQHHFISDLRPRTLYAVYVIARSTHYQSQQSDTVFFLTKDLISDDALSTTSDALVPFRQKVLLAAGLAFVFVLFAVLIGMSLFCYLRKLKRKCRSHGSPLFENASYSGIEDTQLASESSGGETSDQLVISVPCSRESVTYSNSPGRILLDKLPVRNGKHSSKDSGTSSRPDSQLTVNSDFG